MASRTISRRQRSGLRITTLSTMINDLITTIGIQARAQRKTETAPPVNSIKISEINNSKQETACLTLWPLRTMWYSRSPSKMLLLVQKVPWAIRETVNSLERVIISKREHMSWWMDGISGRMASSQRRGEVVEGNKTPVRIKASHP